LQSKKLKLDANDKEIIQKLAQINFNGNKHHHLLSNRKQVCFSEFNKVTIFDPSKPRQAVNPFNLNSAPLSPRPAFNNGQNLPEFKARPLPGTTYTRPVVDDRILQKKIETRETRKS
jgi:hypothetical protein